MRDFNPYDEKQLFMLIAQNDIEAFSTIFQTYSKPLYNHAFKLLRSEFWAEELIQEVFIQLWLKRQLLSDVESPSSYLYRMVSNKALDTMRRNALEVKVQYHISNMQVESELQDFNRKDINDRVESLIHAAIEKLPEQRRRIYQLKYQQDYRYEEIAEMLSISKHTVRNQLAKALEFIRAFLIENGGDLLRLYGLIIFSIFF